MALLVGELKAALGLDDSGFDRGLTQSEAKFGRFGKKLETDANRAGKNVAGRFGVGLHGAIGGVVSRSAGIVAAGFAAWGSVKILGGFINDARESAKVGRITEAAIKSTGGAAKITAAQVGDLATSISNATGADDEAIQSGENLLLTFTGIRNEVGKGNDIFNQASSMITDMTAALNDGDVSAAGMKASSIQLGKALNDPIKGVSALQKVGVSFTDSQKKQIKTMVDSGNTMGAQKVILAELSKEFGGAAAAASDPMQKLSVVVGNVKETIGTALLPVVDKAATWLGENLPGAVAAAGRFFTEYLLPPLKTISSFITDDLIPVVSGIVSTFAGLGKKIVNAIGPIDLSGISTGIFNDTKAWAGAVIGGLKLGIETGNWGPLGTSLGNGVIGAIRNLGDKSGAILDAVGGLIDKVDWARLGGKVSAGITGLFAGVNWGALGSSLGDSVVNIVHKASNLGVKLGNAFKTLVNSIDWRKVGNDSTGAMISFVEGIDWVRVAKSLGIAVFKSVKIGKQVYDAVIKSATDLVLGMGKAITDAMNTWRVNVNAYVRQVGGDLVRGLWAGIQNAMKSVGGFLKSVVVDPIVNWAKSLFGVHSPSTVFASIGRQLIAGLKVGIATAARGIGTWVYQTVIVPTVRPFVSAGTWLVAHGRNVVAGFKNGIAAIGRTVGRFAYDNVIVPMVRPFMSAGTWLVSHGRNSVAGFKNGIAAIGRTVGRFVYTNVIQPTVRPFASAGTWLLQSGRNVIAGFGAGMRAVWANVTKWVSGIATWIKDHKGPVSLDGRLLIPAGRAIMSGFLSGLQSGAGKAWDFVSKVGGKTKEAVASAYGWIKGLGWPDMFGSSKATLSGFGGGVARWAKVALKALQITHSPASWLGSLLRRMNQESGGNPRAINLWDSNAKRGTPSMGLMQTILPTFNAYAGAYRKLGPWDPLANIIASINYANARYGSAPRGWDRPGGYAHGGWLMPGQLAFNETSKPEPILNQSQWNALAQRGGGTYHFHLEGAFIASQQQAEDWLVKSIDKLKQRRRI